MLSGYGAWVIGDGVEKLLDSRIVKNIKHILYNSTIIVLYEMFK